MENFILYYYNINISNVVCCSDYYYFFQNEDMYYFCISNRLETEITSIVSYPLENKYHILIKNKFNKYLTEYNDKTYILFKINTLLDDHILFNNLLLNYKIPVIKPRLLWQNIWQTKIDYMEEQMKELGIGKEILINSFSYYIGLGENAISYLHNIKQPSLNISLVHYRIYFPNIPINYYNTLSLIEDYDVRDYAEYIKSYFFNSNDYNPIDDIKSMLAINKYTYTDYILLYARLLYPTYYFDLFSQYINMDNYDENKIINILNKQNSYELFLKDCYYEIKNKYNIPEISWIIKRSNKL